MPLNGRADVYSGLRDARAIELNTVLRTAGGSLWNTSQEDPNILDHIFQFWKYNTEVMLTKKKASNILSRPSNGVIYKDVDSDWKLGLPASLPQLSLPRTLSRHP
jgi:hypothetical protein